MLDELKKIYIQALPDKIESIRQYLSLARNGDQEAEQNLRILAHSLHGSGETYGFPDISAAARAVEHADQDTFLKNLTVLITVLQDIAADIDREELQESNPAPADNQILIIEDDPDISSLLKVVLEKQFSNYTFSLCETASKARQILRSAGYKVIILDLVLPDGDGREILALIRQGHHKDTPVFVLSASDNDSIRNECMALGASQFLHKPFKPEVIAQQIKTFVTGAPAPEQSVSTSAGQDRPGKTGNARLLLAEDDELLVRIIRHRLAREDMEIADVGNGKEALEILDKRNFDLLILDVKMPIIDGFEVLTRFRQKAHNADIPVIMLTAMGSEKDVVRGYDLGANDYIVKPFSPVELTARVKNLLKNSAA